MIKYIILLIFLSPNLQAQTYTQNCHAIEDDYVKFSIESQLNLHSDFKLSALAYEDENCKIPYLIFNRYFTIQNRVYENIDLQTQKVTYTVLSDEVARALNSIQFCKIKNWKMHEEKDVTGLECDEYQQLKREQNYYQILKNINGTLKFGWVTKELSGLSPQQRPNEFDSLEFTLQK